MTNRKYVKDAITIAFRMSAEQPLDGVIYDPREMYRESISAAGDVDRFFEQSGMYKIMTLATHLRPEHLADVIRNDFGMNIGVIVTGYCAEIKADNSQLDALSTALDDNPDKYISD